LTQKQGGDNLWRMWTQKTFSLAKRHWAASKDTPWWGIAVVFLAVEYGFDWWRAYTAIPFQLDPFTDVLLLWHQRLLHLPLFLMAYMVVVRNWSWRGLGLAALAVWAVTSVALIDLEVHRVFTNLDVYPNWMKMASGDVNSNYAKIIFAAAVVPLFCARFLQRGWRTMDRFLTLFMAIAVIGTSVLFHWLWIEREYKQVMKRELVHIQQIMPLSEGAFREMCKSSSWGCWMGMPSEKGNPTISELMRKNMKEMTETEACRKAPCVFLSGGFDPSQNEFYPVPMAVYQKEGVWRFVADTSFLSKQFLEIRQNLTTLGIASGTTWGFGLILLWVFHQRRFKKRKDAALKRLNGEGVSHE
jgi:hypothetical protein